MRIISVMSSIVLMNMRCFYLLPVFSAEKRLFTACFPIFRRCFIISRDIRSAFFNSCIFPKKKRRKKPVAISYRYIRSHFCVLSACFCYFLEYPSRFLTQSPLSASSATSGNSVTSRVGRYIHFPRVRSGIACGIPPCATDCSESGVIAIHAAISYTSIGISSLFKIAWKNALNSR